MSKEDKREVVGITFIMVLAAFVLVLGNRVRQGIFDPSLGMLGTINTKADVRNNIHEPNFYSECEDKDIKIEQLTWDDNKYEDNDIKKEQMLMKEINEKKEDKDKKDKKEKKDSKDTKDKDKKDKKKDKDK